MWISTTFKYKIRTVVLDDSSNGNLKLTWNLRIKHFSDIDHI
jgi:hypothetical protein